MSELPKGWVEAELGEVAEVRLGRQRSPDKHTGMHPRPYLRAANVTWDGLNLSDVNQMDFTDEEVEIYGLRTGDVLLNEASGSPKEVGKAALYRGELAECCFQNTLIRVRAGDAIAPEFIHHRLLNDARSGRFVEHGRGIGINHLGSAKMQTWPVQLPPLAEQRRIVAKLDDMLVRSGRAKEELAAVPALLERYRQSVLAAAFRGDLTADWRAKNPDVATASAPMGHVASVQEGAMSLLPCGWAWRRLGDLGKDPGNAVQTGPFGAQLHNTDFVERGVPVIAVGNLTGMGFTDRGLYFVTPQKAATLDRYSVDAGDVLFARSGATLAALSTCVGLMLLTPTFRRLRPRRRSASSSRHEACP